MTTHTIYVNTAVNTGIYGTPDAKWNTGSSRDGVSTTSGFVGLLEAFNEVHHFLDHSYGNIPDSTASTKTSSTIASGDTVVFECYGGADLIAEFTEATTPRMPDNVTVQGGRGYERIIVRAGTGNINTTGVFDSSKYHLKSTHSYNYYVIRNRWDATYRNLQFLIEEDNTGFPVIYDDADGSYLWLDNCLFVGDHGDTGSTRPILSKYYWYYGLKVTNNVVVGFVGDFVFRLTELTQYTTAGAPLAFVNNSFVRCGKVGGNIVSIRQPSGTAVYTAYCVNNLFDVVCTIAWVTSSIGSDTNKYNNAFVSGFGLDGDYNPVDISDITNELEDRNASNWSNTDCNLKSTSNLDDTGAEYSGSGYQSFVPTTDFLGQTKGSTIGWCIGALGYLAETTSQIIQSCFMLFRR